MYAKPLSKVRRRRTALSENFESAGGGGLWGLKPPPPQLTGSTTDVCNRQGRTQGVPKGALPPPPPPKLTPAGLN